MTNRDPPAGAPARGAADAAHAPPAAAHDICGEECGAIDDIVPSHGYHRTPTVGLGGSAGSIGALQSFFESLPPDPGMVFVVILHLSPNHASALPEMLQRWTRMRVAQAEDAQPPLVDHVYVIPPAKHLTMVDGHFRLSDLEREQGRRMVIDLFLRSLADTHGPHAAAIVLSGADADGTLGIKRIKERGGLTIAQDPDEAEHDGMPRAAIGTGMVDWVLPVREMPRRLIAYIAHERRLHLPPAEEPQPLPSAIPAGEPESTFGEILAFLRTRTGRDFSYYKRATTLRRISRRMQVSGVDDMAAYLEFLRTHQGECGALLKDLLISVTNFFRDREAFTALEAHLAELFQGKGHSDTIRVWCPACATGEEAYSLAMQLIEYARTVDAAPGIQVFGCDLDEDAIQMARAGIYPETIAADVSEERLRRYFVREHRGYRVRREVRETVLFAAHDLLKDAPFSRIDLISCRNLLIYLNRDAQDRLLDIFHFALRQDGLLFLGTSESVEDGSPLFEVVDKKHRIYRRKTVHRFGLPVAPGPSSLLVRQIEQQVAAAHANAEHAARPVVVPAVSFSPSAAVALRPPVRAAAIREEDRLTWAELHFKLLERFGPPSVLVDRDCEIQHLSESAGKFLQVAGGQPTTNLLRLIHPELRVEIRALLFRALQTGEIAEAQGVAISLEGQRRSVHIRVAPAKDLAPGYLLVTFDLREAAPLAGSTLPDLPTNEGGAPPESVVQYLERELEHLKSHLRDTVEQYEASTEELKASNEELQAMNEELRSATEELETSREELQSINEELTTVNQESKNKVDELAHTNSDLQNLMSATAIATVFLDRDLRVMRFTPSAAPIFNLIPGDVGRPLSDLQHRIDYPALQDDAERVLQTLQPMEREVHGAGGACYLARMLPYRTVEDRIAGVVLTFVDITERQRVAEELRLRHQELQQVNHDAAGRRQRITDLEREVNALLGRLGEAPRYPAAQEKPTA